MGRNEDPKGVYRSIYCSIWDDPDFRKLTKDEKLVFLNLKISPLSNLPEIFPFYIDAIEKQTGISRKGIVKALDTLCHTLWIKIEDGICWIRNGLKYDPNISLSNPKHRESIRKTILSLPKIPLVLEFCEYYNLDIPYSIPYQIPYANQNKDKDIGIRNKDKDCEKIRYLDFVFLTEDEYQKLVDRFGEEGVKDRIENLNEGIGSKGYKYDSHYHTILSWERMKKERNKHQEKPKDRPLKIPESKIEPMPDLTPEQIAENKRRMHDLLETIGSKEVKLHD